MDKGIELREGTTRDGAEIAELCRRMDPVDYVPAAWGSWTSNSRDVNLVAVCDGRIVGCVHAGRVSPTEVFFQGVRVVTELRRRDLATRMMRGLSERLRAVGVSVMRCTTAATNHAAQSVFRKLGIHEVGAVARRRRPASAARTKSSVAASAVATFDPARWPGLLSSRPGSAHFKRIYASPNRRFWNDVTREGRLIGIDDQAFALLDPPSNGGATWVSALTGQIESIRPLLAGLVASAERELTVDAPPEPEIQQILDDLECTPAGPDDRYVILEGPAS